VNDPVSFSGYQYYTDDSYGIMAPYFAHPLYVVDFLEGIITGTNVLTSLNIFSCTDTLRTVIIDVL
jgi:hypothetical protein